jgi:hypothetical protein
VFRVVASNDRCLRLSCPGRASKNSRSKDGDVPHSLKPTRRCRHPEVETIRKPKATCVEPRFLAEAEYRYITSERLPSRQLPVSVAAEVC